MEPSGHELFVYIRDFDTSEPVACPLGNLLPDHIGRRLDVGSEKKQIFDIEHANL